MQLDAAKKRYAKDMKLMDKSSEPKGYSVSKKPEPTFKSNVDDIVSGAKKFNSKIKDTLVKGISKAVGKEEPGILGKYSNFSKKLPETKKEGYAKPTITKLKKGGSVSSASKRADGCCTKGKTKGRII